MNVCMLRSFQIRIEAASAVLLIALYAPVLFGADVTIGSVTALAGSIAAVPVDLSVNQPIRNLGFRISYDPSKVTFFKIVPEGLGSDWFANATLASPGNVDVTLSPGAPVSAIGRVGSLVFTIAPSSVEGTRASLTISGFTISLPDGTSLTGSGTNGAIEGKGDLAAPMPPFPPTLSATAESSASVRIAWSRTPGATSFELFENGSSIYSGSEDRFVRTSLAPSTRYCFKVRGIGAAGSGDASAEVCATTAPQCTAPSSAPALTATASGTSRVVLSWQTSPNASGFQLSRGSEQIYAGAATTFTDEARSPGTQYCYSIRGTSACGDGPAASSVCATTAPSCTPPSSAPSLVATPVSPNVVALEWGDVAGATTYEVRRDDIKIFEGPTTSTVDLGLPAKTQFSYVLRAINPCGERASALTSVTTFSAVSEAWIFSHLAGPSGGADSRDGAANGAGFSRPGSIAVDRDGNAYVADTDNQTIRRISAAGIVTTIAGAPEKPGSADGTGSAARFSSPEGVALDAAGNLYVADTNNGTIRKVTQQGVVTTIAGKAGERAAIDGPVASARFYTPVGIAVDAVGTIYVSDLWVQTIRKIGTNGQVTTVAGSPGISGSTDGTGSAARFNLPSGIALDAAGNVFVGDFSNELIRKVTPAGVVTTVAGLAGARGSADGTGSAARFRGPYGVAVGALGDIIVADQGNNTIRKITPGGTVTTFAGSPEIGGSTDGVGTEARFYLQKQVTVDRDGNVWVADTGNSTIRRITPDAKVTTVAGKANLSGAVDGTGASARFNAPNQIAIDPGGSIVVADSENQLIRRVSPEGVTTTVAGVVQQTGSSDGPASSAKFRGPMGVAVDASGNVFVADSENYTIRKITTSGTVSTFAGAAGQKGSVDGTGGSARFDGPRSVAVGQGGIVYVTDRESHTIRRITADGVVTTLAGVAGKSGNADGAGAAARFQYPHGLATDLDGSLIMTDWGNHTIRRVTAQGVVTTLAGSPGVAGIADGRGNEARFSGPQGVAIDEAGDIYIGDSWNQTVRKLGADGDVTTVAGMPRGVGSRDGWGSTSRFSNPIGMATAPGNTLFVADCLNHAIRRALPCPANALCLGDARFTLSLEAKDPRTGTTGSGLPILQSDLFGYFAIPALTGNSENPEVFVKMLDGRGVNGSHWVFFGGLTDFEYRLVVTDTDSGRVRVYTKPGFGFCGGADTSAFGASDATPGRVVEFAAGTPASEGDGEQAEASSGACDAANELCLLAGKFAVGLVARDPRTGTTGAGLPIPQTELFGYFAVPALTSNPDNPEIFVKMLDGRGVNGRFWFFYGGLTDFEVTLTVRDTESGAQRSYTKEGGTFCGGADTGAFRLGNL